MEKIKLKDGTVFDIVSGSDEYVNIIAPTTDEVVSYFTDENLSYCEILADAEEDTEPIARAAFSNKHMKDFRAELVNGKWDIVITLEDFNEITARLAALEEAQMIHEEAIVELASLLG